MKPIKQLWALVCLFVLLIIALGMMSCTKDIKQPTCHFYTLYSDKYTGDSLYVKTDTLSMPYSYACGKDLDSMKAHNDRWDNNCVGYAIEHNVYSFDNQSHEPVYLKPIRLSFYAAYLNYGYALILRSSQPTHEGYDVTVKWRTYHLIRPTTFDPFTHLVLVDSPRVRITMPANTLLLQTVQPNNFSYPVADMLCMYPKVDSVHLTKYNFIYQ